MYTSTRTPTHTAVRGRQVCECVDKWKLMRKKVLFFCNGKEIYLIIQIRLGFVAAKWAWQSFKRMKLWRRRERCKKLTFVSFRKDSTRPSHVSDSFPERGGGGGVWFLLAEEKKGIVYPYLSILFSGYSTLGAKSWGDWSSDLTHDCCLTSSASCHLPPHPTPSHIPASPHTENINSGRLFKGVETTNFYVGELSRISE